MTASGAGEAEALQHAALAMGLALDAGAAAQLGRYLDLLLRWNATYNLTAVRDRDAMRLQHLVDCLAVVEPLRRARAVGPQRLLDVGSGGGLPGVVIALLCPAWAVVCVDTVGKKAAFIRQVALELGLRNLAAEHARVEALKLPLFDVITSRAFASLAEFVEFTQQQLAPAGIWVAMKGKLPTEEIAELKPDIDVFHVEQLTVPGLEADRCLVWMQPRRGRQPA